TLSTCAKQQQRDGCSGLPTLTLRIRGEHPSRLSRITQRDGANAMRKLVISCATVALSLFALATGSANATPIGFDLLKSATSKSAVTQPFHYRGYRHCHRRYGYRRCHGGYAYYGYGPSIVLGFGGRWHHHHHFRGFR